MGTDMPNTAPRQDRCYLMQPFAFNKDLPGYLEEQRLHAAEYEWGAIPFNFCILAALNQRQPLVNERISVTLVTEHTGPEPVTFSLHYLGPKEMLDEAMVVLRTEVMQNARPRCDRAYIGENLLNAVKPWDGHFRKSVAWLRMLPLSGCKHQTSLLRAEILDNSQALSTDIDYPYVLYMEPKCLAELQNRITMHTEAAPLLTLETP